MSRNTLTIASREPFKVAIWDTWLMVDLTMNGNEMVDLTTRTGYPIFRQTTYPYHSISISIEDFQKWKNVTFFSIDVSGHPPRWESFASSFDSLCSHVMDICGSIQQEPQPEITRNHIRKFLGMMTMSVINAAKPHIQFPTRLDIYLICRLIDIIVCPLGGHSKSGVFISRLHPDVHWEKSRIAL